MNTIQEQWSSFAALVVPKDAPAVQVTEMRRAFYAGAEAMMRINCAIGERRISEEAGMQILDGCMDEMKRFALQIAQGTA
jgi:hypothetical protein